MSVLERLEELKDVLKVLEEAKKEASSLERLRKLEQQIVEKIVESDEFKQIAKAVESILTVREDCFGLKTRAIGIITVTASLWPAFVTVDEDGCDQVEPVETLEDLVTWLTIAKRILQKRRIAKEEEFKRVKEKLLELL